MSYLATFGALTYTALLRAHLDEVGGGLAPKALRSAAAGILIREDRHFYWSTSAGPQGDEFLAPRVDRDGIGQTELPFQFIIGVGCL